MILGPGRFNMPQDNITHWPQLLNWRAAITEACPPRAGASNQEKPAHCKEENPQSMEDPAHSKIKKKNKLNHRREKRQKQRKTSQARQ